MPPENETFKPMPLASSIAGIALAETVEILRALGANDQDIRQAILTGIEKGLPGR